MKKIDRGFSCIELFVVTAFLAVAYSAISREVQASADWKKSGELASRAISQAKRHNPAKEEK